MSEEVIDIAVTMDKSIDRTMAKVEQVKNGASVLKTAWYMRANTNLRRFRALVDKVNNATVYGNAALGMLGNAVVTGAVGVNNYAARNLQWLISSAITITGQIRVAKTLDTAFTAIYLTTKTLPMAKAIREMSMTIRAEEGAREGLEIVQGQSAQLLAMLENANKMGWQKLRTGLFDELFIIIELQQLAKRAEALEANQVNATTLGRISF